jgi:hypothetical protein
MQEVKKISFYNYGQYYLPNHVLSRWFITKYIQSAAYKAHPGPIKIIPHTGSTNENE